MHPRRGLDRGVLTDESETIEISWDHFRGDAVNFVASGVTREFTTEEATKQTTENG